MERERISITLRKSVLMKLDRTIDGMKIRNRSHAVEYYLSKALDSGVRKAVVLAGGAGTQMRPLTYEVPKALIPIHGKPLLEYTIDLLKKYGIREIILSIGHLGEKIKEHFGDGSRFGVRITYVKQDGELGTGGALATISGLLNSTFLLIHGDVLVDIDIDDLLSSHQESDFLGTIALTSVTDPSAYGVVGVKRDRIVSFDEKPEEHTSNLINAGIYVFEPEIFEQLGDESPLSLEKTVFPKLVNKENLGAYIFAGAWHDVSTPDEYEKALKYWKKHSD
jgi:mannose-1-phosphate guanylyltransferase